MTSWPGILGGADVHATVGQPFQVGVFLGDRVAVPGDPGRQVAARRAGEQEFLAEQRRGDRLQVEVGQADQVRDPVPFGLPRRPGGRVLAALAGSPDSLVLAQPAVPADGASQVDPGQQVPGPAERPPRDSGGDPAAQDRRDESGLRREQPRVRGVAFVAAPRQPARHGGGNGGVGDDVAWHVGGVQDPGGRPGGQDDGQREPLGRGVQVPVAQPRPRRLSDQGRLVLVLRVSRDRAGPGVPGFGHRAAAIQGVSVRARRGSPGRGRCRVLPAQAPSPVTHRPSCVISPPLPANSLGSS